MAERLLLLQGVTAGYDQDIDVLREVSLEVNAGEISGLIGLNGAGKSTVVKTICGFLAPKAGRIELEGESIAGIDRGICCIPQESSLFPYLSVEENLLLPLQGRAKRYAGGVDARYEEVLTIFPALASRRRAQAGDLSGGQQKQVEFAKAWLQRPRLCLIDEPSIGLAPCSRRPQRAPGRAHVRPHLRAEPRARHRFRRPRGLPGRPARAGARLAGARLLTSARR